MLEEPDISQESHGLTVSAANGARITRHDDWSTYVWILMTPAHRKRVYTSLPRIRGKNDFGRRARSPASIYWGYRNVYSWGLGTIRGFRGLVLDGLRVLESIYSCAILHLLHTRENVDASIYGIHGSGQLAVFLLDRFKA